MHNPVSMRTGFELSHCTHVTDVCRDSVLTLYLFPNVGVLGFRPSLPLATLPALLGSVVPGLISVSTIILQANRRAITG